MTWFPAAILLMVAIGFSFLTVTATTNTLFQMLSPNAVRGRVLSVFVFVFGGIAPLGSLWTGAVADLAGTKAPLFAGGLLRILVGIGGWRAFASRRPDLQQTTQPPLAPTETGLASDLPPRDGH